MECNSFNDLRRNSLNVSVEKFREESLVKLMEECFMQCLENSWSSIIELFAEIITINKFINLSQLHDFTTSQNTQFHL